MRPQDEAIVNNLGPQGIANGRKALNAASNLARNVFPGSGPIINRDGAIQTKWGQYALNNPEVVNDRTILVRVRFGRTWRFGEVRPNHRTFRFGQPNHHRTKSLHKSQFFRRKARFQPIFFQKMNKKLKFFFSVKLFFSFSKDEISSLSYDF